MFLIKIYIKESYINYYHTIIQMCGQYCILALGFFGILGIFWDFLGILGIFRDFRDFWGFLGILGIFKDF